jgi:hypothetical protein
MRFLTGLVERSLRLEGSFDHLSGDLPMTQGLVSRMIAAVIIGAGATAFVDAWNFFLARAFGVPSLSYCMLGRWVAHMPGGTFRHVAISTAPTMRFECSLGWMTHYAIGISLAAAFLLLAPAWLSAPTSAAALLYGIGTVVLPFFVMQPALGLGVASAAARRPGQARLKSLATHFVYGLGLYAWGLMLASLQG